ncbi:conserved hypothetical protein [Carboxydothermus hydrogenoformans Z-2901]|uniref:SHOCT domain-containing protein n=2 Tax=Carboxydothermus TaxID=129957 RepID=Q3A9F9_CARHZ|nr:conserved hypothetical protein [Carboxydothermus hydrogenoformans Z-2901]
MMWYFWDRLTPWNMLGGIFMMILMFLFWAVVIYFIFKLLTRNDIINKVTSGKSPEELLKERYARGEITKEQYEEMLQDLRK